jgi:hypothetical protein
MKRFLSVFLVICLMASFAFGLPVCVLAAEAEGENTTGKIDWMGMFNKWSEEGLPAPIAAFLAAYDVFEAATLSLAKSVWRVFKFFVPMVKASF